MFLLILESLGSMELFFILVMALVFFGPRKLPQLSRSLGKSLAEFRRASDEFKTTWAREVNLEEAITSEPRGETNRPNENSILEEKSTQPSEFPTIEPVLADRVIPREPKESISENPSETQLDTAAGDSSRKHDWL